MKDNYDILYQQKIFVTLCLTNFLQHVLVTMFESYRLLLLIHVILVQIYCQNHLFGTSSATGIVASIIAYLCEIELQCKQYEHFTHQQTQWQYIGTRWSKLKWGYNRQASLKKTWVTALLKIDKATYCMTNRKQGYINLKHHYHPILIA